MARIKIDLPEKYIFETELVAQVGDLNYGGHVGNDRFLLYAHETRVRFLQANDLSELSVGDNIGLIMTDSAVVYKAEVFLGDKLKVELGVQDVSRIGFDLIYRISNQETGKEVAHIKTGMLCFDYEKRKMAMIPESFKSILGTI
ncbi:MAG: thioesterase [Cytophagales bacterium]|nr:thioesterase [Cytophagales bacterium]